MKLSKTPEQELSTAWDGYLYQICSNLRQLGLLLNDFSVAAPMIAAEVNREDLIKIAAVRRFNPELYDAIYRHPDFVTYSQSWIKNPVYIPEDIRKKRNEEAVAQFARVLEQSSAPEAYRALLISLFPLLKTRLDPDNAKRRIEQDFSVEMAQAKKEKRISHPNYFPVYFRYQIPDSIVGSREFSGILLSLEKAKDEDVVYGLLAELIGQLPAGSLKRYDLLERLCEETLGDEISTRICYALARLADKYQYDLVDIGEASLALDFVSSSAQRMSPDVRMRVLRETMARSSDDTFALRILERATPREDGARAKIKIESTEQEALVNAFRLRMVRRYGQKRSPQTTMVQTSDPRAFWRWAGLSPNDKALALKFWRRYVSQDKARLAWVFEMSFLPYGWSKDPAPTVGLFFTNKYLEHGLSHFHNPRVPETDSYRDALRWMEDYLAGKFVGGISPFWRRGFQGDN